MFKTRRLALEPFSVDDAEDLFLIRGDDQAMTHWDWPADRSISESFAAANQMLREMATGASLYWTARLLENRSFIGVFDLSSLTENDGAELGFMVCRAHWGCGYAREACDSLVEFAWDQGRTHVNARIHAGNVRSIALLARMGFVATDVRAVEVRPGVMRTCRFMALRNPAR